MCAHDITFQWALRHEKGTRSFGKISDPFLSQSCNLIRCPLCRIYCRTGNFRVQENFAIFAKIGGFAKISCRENVVLYISFQSVFKFFKSDHRWKALDPYNSEIREIFLSRTSRRHEFAKFSCRENFLFYSNWMFCKGNNNNIIIFLSQCHLCAHVIKL